LNRNSKKVFEIAFERSERPRIRTQLNKPSCEVSFEPGNVLKRTDEAQAQICAQNSVPTRGELEKPTYVKRGASQVRAGLFSSFAIILIVPFAAAAQEASAVDGIADLRAIKEQLLDGNDGLSQIRDHVALLTELYAIDAESAFAARLDSGECTARAAPGICAALWPFYSTPGEAVRPDRGGSQTGADQ
jgi:hypothetical protein